MRRYALPVMAVLLVLAIAWILVRRADRNPETVPTEGTTAREARDRADVDSLDRPAEGSNETDTVATDFNGGTVTGVVVDPEFTPIVGATVLLLRDREGDSGDATLTGPDGRFSLAKPEAQAAVSTASLRVLARKAGFTEVEAFVAPRGSETAPGDHTLVLYPAGSIRGTVYGLGSGEPLASIRVAVENPYPIGLTARGSTLRIPELVATTDARGEFRLDHVCTGVRRVRAAANLEGFAAEREIEIEPGDDAEVVLSVPEPFDLSGRVTDSVSGDPIEGAEVTLDAGQARTDAEGRYSFRNPAWSSYPLADRLVDVKADAPDHVRATRELLLPHGNLRVTLDIELEPAASVRGSVVDAAGRPAGAHGVFVVDLRDAEASGGIQSRREGFSGVTDLDGTFRIDGLPSGRRLRLEIGGVPGYGYDRDRSLPPFTLDAGEVRELPPIVLPTPLVIRGQVIDIEERPVAGAHVAACAVFPNDGPSINCDVGADADDEGRFEIEFRNATALEPLFPVALRASREIRGIPGPVVSVVATREKPASGVVLRVPPSHSLEVRLLFPDRPEPHEALRGSIELKSVDFKLEDLDPRGGLGRSEGPWIGSRSLDLDGSCHWEHLAPGTYELRVNLHRWSGSPIVRRAPRTTVRIPQDRTIEIPVEESVEETMRSPFAGRIRVHIVDAETGMPVPRPVLFVQPEQPILLRLVADGRPEEGLVADAPLGQRQFLAAGDSYVASEPMEIFVGAGRVEGPFWFRLRRGRTLEGILRLPDGSPAPFAPVVFTPAAGPDAGSRQSLTDAAGRFAVRGLPDGEIAVASRFQPQDAPDSRVHIFSLETVLEAGTDGPLDLRLEEVDLSGEGD